jgi:predicted ATP-dependent endonuclease of OLD family
MLDYYCTFLIDEPESFLHPPQANIMGRIIGETLSDNQQAFISTHSEDIIKGLLSVCPNRIKIIRITRDGDQNSFAILDNDTFNDVWNDPLLKHSNIMSSLFHKHVVLCESDSDCKLYSIIESHLKRKEDKYSETLYIHCGGKHRMAKIAKALKMLNIDTKLIPDIDVLNDENVFRNIVEAFGIEWASIESKYSTIVGNLHSIKENIKRSEATDVIEHVLSASKYPILSKKEIETIKEALKTVSKWASLKEFGVNAIPRGDATVAFADMNTILKEHGIYIVPVGELECFIKEVGGHGPDWVNIVLEKYPDLDHPVYEDIKQFIQSINL